MKVQWNIRLIINALQVLKIETENAKANENGQKYCQVNFKVKADFSSTFQGEMTFFKDKFIFKDFSRRGPKIKDFSRSVGTLDVCIFLWVACLAGYLGHVRFRSGVLHALGYLTAWSSQSLPRYLAESEVTQVVNIRSQKRVVQSQEQSCPSNWNLASGMWDQPGWCPYVT